MCVPYRNRLARRLALQHPHFRAARIHWSAYAFLTLFSALALIICIYYIQPAADAARTADKVGKHEIAAWSRLLLAVLLVILFAGLILTLRAARFFIRREEKPTKTNYVDAWTESAKRMKTPPEDDSEESPS